MKKNFLLGILSAAVLLTGCGKNDDVYVSFNSSDSTQTSDVPQTPNSSDSPQTSLPDALDELLHGERLCKVSDCPNYNASNCTGIMLSSGGQFDADYLYASPSLKFPQSTPMSEHVRTKLNLRTGEIVDICNIPGCGHDDMDTCPHYSSYSNGQCVGSERWSTFGSEVISSSRDKIMEYKVLFTNPYENKICSPDAAASEKNIIDWMLVAEDKIFLTVGNFIYSVNRDTMTVASEPIEAGENMFLSFCVFGNKAFLCNDVQEMYMVDFEKRTSVKLADKCVTPSEYDGRLYYVKWKDATPWLCSSSLDGDDEREILEDCYLGYLIKDGNVFYTQFKNKDNNLYMYSLESMEKKVLYKGMIVSPSSAPHIDRVFVIIDNEKNDGDRSKAGYYSWKSDGSDPIFISLKDGMRS